MKLDRTFSREFAKIANGDGSREAKFAFKKKAESVAKMLSDVKAPSLFDEAVKTYGRAAVAASLAVTVIERDRGDPGRLDPVSLAWAHEVFGLWKNRTPSILFYVINDGLHPMKIDEYAGSFIRSLSVEM